MHALFAPLSAVQGYVITAGKTIQRLSHPPMNVGRSIQCANGC